MIRILSSQQIKALDAHTIQHEPIASIDLMERACRAFVNWFTEKFNGAHTIAIVCGTGNNGGDGLGIARMLREWSYSVKVFVIRGSSETEDFKTNFERLKGKAGIVEVTSLDKDIFSEYDVLIDAIFGSGLTRPAEGLFAQAIHLMNESEAIRIAVDIPSGLLADKVSKGEIFKAHYTITFQLPKLAFLFPGNHAFTGVWCMVDIGLNKAFIKEQQTPHYYITAKDIKKILRPRSKFDHKGTYGHALIIAGSYGKMGAALLSGRAVLRAGAGLLTMHIPECGYIIL